MVMAMEKELFDEFKQSIREANTIIAGKGKPARVWRWDLGVKGIRDKMGVSQNQLAAMIGVSADTIQNWEQGRSTPRKAARALLIVLKHNPEAVVTAIEAEKQLVKKLG